MIRISQSFLESTPDALKAMVCRVCIDLWEGYARTVAAVLPHRRVAVHAVNRHF